MGIRIVMSRTMLLTLVIIASVTIAIGAMGVVLGIVLRNDVLLGVGTPILVIATVVVFAVWIVKEAEPNENRIEKLN